MKLYTSVGTNPTVVRDYLRQRGQTIETVWIDLMTAENRRPPYTTLNPAGTSPMLQLDDGTCIAESITICEYLDETTDGETLVGRTPVERAITRMWIRRIDVAVTLPMANGWRFAEGLARVGNHVRTMPQAAADLKLVAADGLRWIDGLMGDNRFVCGERLTLADILLHVFVNFADANAQTVDRGLAWIAAWRARMSTEPLAAAA